MYYGYEEFDLDKLAEAIDKLPDADLYRAVCEYCQESGYEIPFDSYELEDHISYMKPYDAFMLGKMMKGSLNDGLYIFNGYANIEATTESEFASLYRDEPDFVEFVAENGLIDEIGLDSDDFIIEEDDDEE